MMYKVRWIVFTIFVAWVLAAASPIQAATEPSGGVSDGTGKALPPAPLTQFLSTTVQGGYVASGAAMRNLGKGKIGLWGVPSGSTTSRAFLYWNLIGGSKPLPDYTNGEINGIPITGTLVAIGQTPCWGDPDANASYTYRSEVTPLISSGINGTYMLTGFASGRRDGALPADGDPLPYLEGATLIVIYQHSGYPDTSVFLYEGASMTSPETGPVLTRITGIPEYQSYLANTTYVIADGQTAPEVGAGIGASTVVAPVPEVDADGTDPVDRVLGSYPGGNFWDTDRATSRVATDDWGIPVGGIISAIRKPGERSVTLSGGIPKGSQDGDCLVHVAQVLSVSDGGRDTDGDGLPDGWEANGYDADSDGKIDVDLPSLGSNPFHKDLYLWFDYMPGYQPTSETMAALVEVFRRGNALNPDRSGGVSLHTQQGNTFPYRRYWIDSCSTWPSSSDPMVMLNNARVSSLNPSQRAVWHYQLWVDSWCPANPLHSQADGIPGDSSLVTTGGGTAVRPQTVMSLHEFGHSLGLGHGGPGASMSNAYAPNHLSVMSYLYQSVFYSGSYDGLDFQRVDLPTLDERCLDENTGLGSSDPILRDYGLVSWYYAGTDGAVHAASIFDTTHGIGGPIDWNQDGRYDTCATVSIDEKPGTTLVGALEVLPAIPAEWPRLVYDGGDVGGPSPEGPAEEEH